MAFHLIDLERWDRREFYHHYLDEARCTWSITVELDVTPLQGEKLYPAMLWLLTGGVNSFPQFRTCLTPEGPGIFDTMEPSYTIFNRERENFSVVWTPFSPDYQTFLHRYEEDVARYRTATTLSPKPGQPENCFDVSMLPWLSFTSFNLNLYTSGDYLLPIFTMGKCIQREGRTLLPLAIQVHHAVCDGYHVARFTEHLQGRIDAWC